MAHEGVKHDYHLVNPSPWPLVGSISAVVLALGLVIGLKGMLGLPKGNWWVLALGVAGVLCDHGRLVDRRRPRRPTRATTRRSSRSACATA